MPYQVNAAQRHKFPKASLAGEELAWVCPRLARARPLNRVGHARSDRRLAGAGHRSARPRSLLLRPGDRDRASVALGVWSTVAAERRPVAFRGDPAGVGLAIPDHTTF